MFHLGRARLLFLVAVVYVFAPDLALPIAVGDALLPESLRFSSAAWQQGGPGYLCIPQLRLNH